MPFTSIITHPGGAHKDDLLACAILIAKAPAPIFRREPTEADLADPEVAVVDVGYQHQPERGNFDHHQFDRDAPPICSLSLVLSHFGLYEDAKQFCDWLQPAEWFDCRGPVNTARMLGVERDIIGKLSSPVDFTLLRRFALCTELKQGDVLWEMLRLVGIDIIDYLESMRDKIDFIAANSEQIQVPSANGEPALFIFLPRTEPLPDEPSAGIGQFVKTQALENKVVGLIYPDRRNSGYGLARFNDHPRLDFTRIEGETDVHFAHKSGFLAKTTATEKDRLIALCQQALD